ncbi:MAG: CPBP family intramembrane metalloprotease [Myxococcales bacterium]|nr:CPBP family intramembrane metalloprotease [Myxococcales bacterium]
MTASPHAAPRTGTASFFLLAFALTWALQIPGVLARRGLLPGDPDAYVPLAMLGIFGPLVAAAILAGREDGRAGLRALFGPLLRARVKVRFYLLALFLPGLLLSGGLALMKLAGYEGEVAYLPQAAQLPVILIISVAEEVGWRGWALPRLTARYGAFAASVILGALWTVWHIPMFMGVGVPLETLPVMLLLFVGGSLFFTWLVRRSGGSLLIAVAAHAGAHLNNSHASIPDGDMLPMLVGAVVYAGLGLAVAYLDRADFGIARRPARYSASSEVVPRS